MSLNLNFTFDDDTYRHSLNGENIVMQCHHYFALMTRLAENRASIGGPAIMQKTAENTFFRFLNDYFSSNQVSDPQERLKVGSEFYSLFGMGKMEISGQEDGGEVKLLHSHIDEGWKQKWGKHHKFVNHFTCGYVAALFAGAFNKGSSSYGASEVKSIVMGEDYGQINVKLK